MKLRNKLEELNERLRRELKEFRERVRNKVEIRELENLLEKEEYRELRERLETIEREPNPSFKEYFLTQEEIFTRYMKIYALTSHLMFLGEWRARYSLIKHHHRYSRDNYRVSKRHIEKIISILLKNHEKRKEKYLKHGVHKFSLEDLVNSANKINKDRDSFTRWQVKMDHMGEELPEDWLFKVLFDQHLLKYDLYCQDFFGFDELSRGPYLVFSPNIWNERQLWLLRQIGLGREKLEIISPFRGSEQLTPHEYHALEMIRDTSNQDFYPFIDELRAEMKRDKEIVTQTLNMDGFSDLIKELSVPYVDCILTYDLASAKENSRSKDYVSQEFYWMETKGCRDLLEDLGRVYPDIGKKVERYKNYVNKLNGGPQLSLKNHRSDPTRDKTWRDEDPLLHNRTKFIGMQPNRHRNSPEKPIFDIHVLDNIDALAPSNQPGLVLVNSKFGVDPVRGLEVTSPHTVPFDFTVDPDRKQILERWWRQDQDGRGDHRHQERQRIIEKWLKEDTSTVNRPYIGDNPHQDQGWYPRHSVTDAPVPSVGDKKPPNIGFYPLKPIKDVPPPNIESLRHKDLELWLLPTFIVIFIAGVVVATSRRPLSRRLGINKIKNRTNAPSQHAGKHSRSSQVRVKKVNVKIKNVKTVRKTGTIRTNSPRYRGYMKAGGPGGGYYRGAGGSHPIRHVR